VATALLVQNIILDLCIIVQVIKILGDWTKRRLYVCSRVLSMKNVYTSLKTCYSITTKEFKHCLK
jgi:hypothetical protein